MHRTVRPFPAGEVALLASFAAHAAVALENARLFEQAGAAVAAADEANAELRGRSEATERAAHLGTLVLHTAEPMDLPERRTLERGAMVTALVLLFRRTEAEAESRVRGELLSDLVSGRDLDPDRLRERARQQGADLEADLVVVVAVPTAEPGTEQQAVRTASTIGREVGGLGGVHEGLVVVLAPGDPIALGEAVRTRLDGATVGVATATGGTEGVISAWREASQTLAALGRLGRSGEVSDPGGLGIARLLLGGNAA